VVTDQGTPVAESDVSSMIVEMGSLYAAEDPVHTSPPAENGILLEFKVDNDKDCHVSLAQNAIRGGVVMEDTTQTFSPSYVTLVECDVVFAPPVPVCETCLGDATGDNKISGADLSAIVSLLSPAYAGTTPPYTVNPVPPGYECYDMSGDGKISGADLSAIVSLLSPAYAGTTPPYTALCP
jgi:hypothetical protein